MGFFSNVAAADGLEFILMAVLPDTARRMGQMRALFWGTDGRHGKDVHAELARYRPQLLCGNEVRAVAAAGCCLGGMERVVMYLVRHHCAVGLRPVSSALRWASIFTRDIFMAIGVYVHGAPTAPEMAYATNAVSRVAQGRMFLIYGSIITLINVLVIISVRKGWRFVRREGVGEAGGYWIQSGRRFAGVVAEVVLGRRRAAVAPAAPQQAPNLRPRPVPLPGAQPPAFQPGDDGDV